MKLCLIFSIVAITIQGDMLDILWRDDHGRTALHKSFFDKDLETARDLLERGIEIDAADSEGSTALHLSLTHGNTKFTILLLEYNADITKVDKYGQNAFHLSGKSYERAVIIVKRFLELGLLDTIDRNGNTALHHSACCGYFRIAKLLINNGADINSASEYGNTALHFSAESGHFELSKLLLENGADIYAVNGLDQTALHLSASEGSLSVSKLLVNCGADIEAVDNNGKTALHLSVENGHIEIAKLLVNCGANFNAVDKNVRFSCYVFRIEFEDFLREYIDKKKVVSSPAERKSRKRKGCESPRTMS